MLLRPYHPQDAGALAGIFFDAVRIGAAPKYPAEALRAWAPERPTAEVWDERLAGLWTVLAEARARPLPGLHTEASRLARPFFLRHGWSLDAAQEVERAGVMIENFRMSLRF